MKAKYTAEFYTSEILQEAANESISFAGLLQRLGIRQAGSTQARIKALCLELRVDTSHFTQQAWAKGLPSPWRMPSEVMLAVLPSETRLRTKPARLRRALAEVGVLPTSCALCGMEPYWNSKPLAFEIDHIDGDWRNNRAENLRFLCPNCHAQQPTGLPYRKQKLA